MDATSSTLRKIAWGIFLILFAVGLNTVYENDRKNVENIHENYIKTEAEITSVGRTGQGLRTRALLSVSYVFNERKYTAHIVRRHEKDGVYKVGHTIAIYINNTNPRDAR